MKIKHCLIIFFWLTISFQYKAIAQVDILEPTSAQYYYSGTIGLSERIEFNLQIKKHAVTGSYIVTSNGDMFVFSGRLDANREGIGLIVYDKDNTYVASIEANFLSETNNFGKRLDGKWRSADGTVTKKIKLLKVAEFAFVRLTLPVRQSIVGE